MRKRLHALLAFLLALCIVISSGVSSPILAAEATAAEAASELNVVEWSLSLGDDISANFYVNISDEVAQTALMNVSVGDDTLQYAVSEAEQDADGNYIFTADIAAARLTDTVTLQLEADSQLGAAYQCTVRQYAQAVLEGEYPEDTKTLVRALLNYGAMAQTYFGYNTDDLANAGYESTAAANIPTEEMEVSVDGAVSGIRYYGATLVFESKVAMRYYFTASGDISAYEFKAGEKTYTPVKSGSRYYVEIPGINPQAYDTPVALAVSDGTDTLTVTYSPMHYIVRMSGGDNESLNNLLGAMYIYHEAAVAYLEEVCIVRDGVSDYEILIPENASEQLQFAAQDFRFFFKEATGVELTITDQAAADGVYFSIGQTSVFAESGMTLSADELGTDGYKVLTCGDSIVMAGTTDEASTYAVYGYLAEQFGLEIYGDDVYEIQNVTDATVAQLDITDVPAIARRSGGISLGWYGTTEYMSRMRLRNMNDGWGLSTHTYFTILPPGTYLADHPDWYDMDSNALCLTNEEMKAQFVENLKGIILNKPDSTYFMLSHEDGEPKCACSDCAAVRSQYGGYHSALMVLFTNDVVRQINAWAAETIPDRTLNFSMIAYTSTEVPPTEKVWSWSSMSYVLQPINNDSGLMTEANLGVMICPISSHVSDPYMSQSYANSVFSGWDVLTDNLHVWAYSCPFGHEMKPFNGFTAYQQNYQAYAEMGVDYVFEQGFLDDYYPGFHELRGYLISKLMWDPYLDQDTLVQNFMRNYYGPGWESIYSFYTEWVAYLESLEASGWYSQVATQLVQDWYRSSLFSQDLLNGYDAYIEAALEANEAIKASDPEAYETYRNNIRFERCMIRNLMLNIYPDSYDDVTYEAMIDEFVEISEIKGYDGAPVVASAWYARLAEETSVVTADCFTGSASFADLYTKEDGELTHYVQVSSGTYQPSFYFTEEGVEMIQAYAEANGYDTMTIHSYAELYNNGFVINGTFTARGAWKTTTVKVSDLSTDFHFWSQSEGATKIKMWFEFGVITTSSFAGSCSVSEYEGTVADVTFKGFKITSSSYQPLFYLTADAVTSIKNYAAKNAYATLKVHAYAKLYNNALIVNGVYTPRGAWKTAAFAISELPDTVEFWSQSEGATEVYLWFEFADQAVIHAGDITGTGSFATSNFTGTVGDVALETAVKITSSEYQPYFYFTADAVATIQSYAEANGYDTLRIHSYAILYNNGFIVNGAYTGIGYWAATDVAICDVSTTLAFWSQSEGATEVYLWFEFVDLPAVNASSFTGSGSTAFSNYSGTVGDVALENAVKVTSSEYQPYFYFTADAVTAIQSYAEENGYDTLRIHAYAKLTNNLLVVNKTLYVGAAWKSLDVDIATLTNALPFWSQSEGTTEVYLWFEFVDLPVINASSFTGASFANYTGTVDEVELENAVKMTSSDYQPKFYFTEAAVTAIKAYAAEEGCDTLVIHANAGSSYDGQPCFGNVWLAEEGWTETSVTIEDLTAAYEFWHTSAGTTEIYLWFEFIKDITVSASSFTGSCSFSDYEGTVEGVTFTGVKATSSTYQPHFYFSADGVAKIQAYAEKHGYTTLTVHAYAILKDNGFVVGSAYFSRGTWGSADFAISDISTAFDFWSQSQGTTEIYMWFEFS